MFEETIRSLQNPRVKHLVKLREGKNRRREQLFLIEGEREVERAIQSGAPVTEFYYCAAFRPNAGEYDFSSLAEKGIQCYELSQETFAKASCRDNPDGFLAICKMWNHSLETLNLPERPLLLVLEKVEKPGNLGTLLRTAEAAGVDAVILTETLTDPFHPQVVRSAQGILYALPFVMTDNATLQAWLVDKQIAAILTTPEGSIPLWEVPMTQGVALFLGNEAMGLSDFWLSETEGVAKAMIPMNGASDSLNVSAAAAIFLFEAVRQRSSVARS
jgi:TrmH family RNA methyltransferase